MISFLILGSSKIQPWAIEHPNNGDIKDNLLSRMLKDFNTFDRYSFLFLEENGEKSVKLTLEV
jgi:hypothetical protein